MQNTKEIDFSTTAAKLKFLLKVALKMYSTKTLRHTPEILSMGFPDSISAKIVLVASGQKNE